jgi:alpha-glucosidase
VLGNHDVSRTASRYVKNEDDARVKVIMALLLTLRGTPFIYYGEEIGMRDISLKRGQILDPPGKKYWPFYKGRDGCRSPMQWNASENGGFSKVRPWLPVHPNYTHRNVAGQETDQGSMLNFTRRILQLRREYPALRCGDFNLITRQPQNALAYLRESDGQTILVALNFRNRSVRLDNLPAQKWELLYSPERCSTPDMGRGLSLFPYEVLLLKKS